MADKTDVMISYAHVNSDLLKWVVAVLHHMGVSVWYDDGIRSGNWQDQIDAKIAGCKVQLIIWTADTAKSEECANEAIVARAMRKSIIPLFFANTPYTKRFDFLTKHQGVEYFKGDDLKNNMKLRQLLYHEHVEMNVNADLASLDSRPGNLAVTPVPPEPRSTPLHAELASEVAEILGCGGVYTLATDLSNAQSPSFADFCTLRIPPDRWANLERELHSIPADATSGDLVKACRQHGVAALLIVGAISEAAELSRERVRAELSYEALREAALANFALALESNIGVASAARAAMCLAVLEHSPSLSNQGNQQPDALKNAVNHLFELLLRNAGERNPDADEEDMTGGLSIRDFVVVERRSAAFLARNDYRVIKTDRAPLLLAYGYGFANDFGVRWRLKEKARELPPIAKDLSFTPLFGAERLLELSRRDEVLSKAMTFLQLAGSVWRPQAVQLIGSCALEKLRESFKVEHLASTEGACEAMMDLIPALHEFRGARGPLDAEVAEIIDGARADCEAALRNSPEDARLNDWLLPHIEELATRAAKAIGGLTEMALQRLTRVVERQRAKMSRLRGEQSGVITHFSKALAAGYELNREDLHQLFWAWYHVALEPSRLEEAVGELKKVLARIEQVAADSKQIPEMKEYLGKLEERLRSTRGGLEDARDAYAQNQSPDALLALTKAARREAVAQMTGAGPHGVIALFKDLWLRFPACNALKSLVPELCATWKADDTFKDDDIEALLDLYSDATVTSADPPPDAKPVLTTLNDARAKFTRTDTGATRAAFLIEIKKEARRLFNGQGWQAAADFIRNLRGEFPNFSALADLPRMLSEELARTAKSDEITRFLKACSQPASGKVPTVEVREPKRIQTADVLLAPKADDAARRLEEYKRLSAVGTLRKDLRVTIVPDPAGITLLIHEPAPGGADLAKHAVIEGARTQANTTARLRLEGAPVTVTEANVTWAQGVGRAHFPSAKVGTSASSLAGHGSIHVAGAEILRLDFRSDAGAKATPVTVRRHERVYACFATRDEAAVCRLIEKVRAVVPDWTEVTCDASLRVGDDWRRVKGAILQCQVFYLFWSREARDSAWVHWDWQYALKQFPSGRWIVPIPLESSQDAPPPEELLKDWPIDEWNLAHQDVKRFLD